MIYGQNAVPLASAFANVIETLYHDRRIFVVIFSICAKVNVPTLNGTESNIADVFIHPHTGRKIFAFEEDFGQ